MERFSARDAKLDSKSPVSRVLFFCSVSSCLLDVVFPLVIVCAPVREVGCNTPPNESKPSPKIYILNLIKLRKKARNKTTIASKGSFLVFI